MAQLRQMIYQLAVTGTLTARGETEEDAASLLASIRDERTRLIRAKRYNRMLEFEGESISPPQGI